MLSYDILFPGCDMCYIYIFFHFLIDSTLKIAFLSTGYYCTSGVDRPMPGASNDTTGVNCSCPTQAFHTGVGGVCPMGHHCPTGSDLPTACAAGSYADQEGLAACLTCPEGYYCLAGAQGFLNASCPVGEFWVFYAHKVKDVFQTTRTTIRKM